jgi:hypothetical protein
MAEAESEPLGRARRRSSAEARAVSEPWGRVKRSSSSSGAEPEFAVFRALARVRALGRAERSSSSSGLSPSPSPGSGGAEFAVFRVLARVRALGRAERSSPSSGAEPESEPWVGRSGVRRLPGLSPCPSPGSGGAEFAVFRALARVRALGRAERSSPSSGAEPVSEPWVGRSGVRRLLGLSPSPSPGSGGASYGAFGRAWLPLSLNAPATVTPGFRRQTECEPCTCQDQKFTYTAIT